MSQRLPQQLSVMECIEAGAKQLTAAGVSFGHGTQNAFDEAAWLILWQLGVPLDTLDSVKNLPITQAQHNEIASLFIARIETRKPAAYLTREAWLQGVSFYVDERAIVPRSLIAELLVDPDLGAQLDVWLPANTRRVLDLCTGNGSLAVLAAMAFPEISVEGADLSLDALAVADINVNKHALQKRITLFQSDVLAKATGEYDLIFCNPPYVNAKSMELLPAEYQKEPRMALDGNACGSSDGMDFVRKLLAQVSSYMREQAVLVLEIGHERTNFETAFPGLEVVWLQTSAGPDQVLLISRDMLSRAKLLK